MLNEIARELVAPVAASLLTAFITSWCYAAIQEGKRRTDAIHSSMQLYIGLVSKNELEEIQRDGIKRQYLLSLHPKDDSVGEYYLSIDPLDKVEICAFNANTFKRLRLLNVGDYGAVMREVMHSSGSHQRNFVLERKERYFIDRGTSIDLYVQDLECPDQVRLDYPKYQLIFKEINAVGPYVLIPTVESYRIKKNSKRLRRTQ